MEPRVIGYPLGSKVCFIKKTGLSLLLLSRKSAALVKVPLGLKIIAFTNYMLIVNINTDRSFFHSYHALLTNLFSDLCYGFNTALLLKGVGYKVFQRGKLLVFKLGFTHDTFVVLPLNVKVRGITEKNSLLFLNGSNRCEVGQVISRILSIRVPDAYRGKGIHLKKVPFIPKAGKKAYR